MDHDRLFKKILTTFFFEFLEVFMPAVAAYVDRGSIEFLDKEAFPAGLRKKISDLVVKVKYRGKDVFFLIHVEHQSRSESGFPKRIFLYFAGLLEKYDLDVYPVVIYSHDSPRNPEPYRYEVDFPNRKVLKFEYEVIQLNRLPWRRFVKQPNPAAAALMARMSIPPEDRPKVKAQCLRLLATLRLDADKSELIYSFVDSYLRLTAEENRIYERELGKFEPEMKESAMEIMSSLKKEGIKIGEHLGLEKALEIMLEQRFSTLPTEVTERLDGLSTAQLENLVRAMKDFSGLAELGQWLDDNPPLR